MSESFLNADHLLELMGAACSEDASEYDLAELNSLLLADEASRRCYLSYCRMYAAMRLELRAQRAARKACQQDSVESLVQDATEPNVGEGDVQSSTPPVCGFLSTAISTMLDGFSSDWLVAYLAAVAIFGIGLLIGAITHVSQPVQVAKELRPITEHSSASLQKPGPAIVGRITGLVDCEWSDPKLAANRSVQVTLGCKYALASGLMEITYNTGAKVILQGPVIYEADSKNGGFMSLGRLTGKVATQNAKGFSVRTPAAIVTDLGTEFGIELDNSGNCDVHVFRGSVEAKAVPALGNAPPQILKAGQIVRVGKAGIQPLPRSNSQTFAAQQKKFAPSARVDQDFEHTRGKSIQLNGTAYICLDSRISPLHRLRLTVASNRSVGDFGSAWYAVKQPAANGFVAKFRFQVTGKCEQGQSLMFVVQNTADSKRLLDGRASLPGALCIVIESGNVTPSISVQDARKVLASADLKWRLGLDSLIGRTHTVQIRYHGGRLDVVFDNVLVISDATLSLASLGGGSAVDADGDAWIGFIAGAPHASVTQDILAWQFDAK